MCIPCCEMTTDESRDITQWCDNDVYEVWLSANN